MRTINLILLSAPLLVGCQTAKVEATVEENNKLNYSDFRDLFLEWKNLFSPAKSQYFAYIFSYSCSHCEHIKEEVLSTIGDMKDWFYLIEYSKEIPIKSNVMETIGREKIEEIYIMGTPTLIGISNKYVSINIAGEKEILEYLQLLPHMNCDY